MPEGVAVEEREIGRRTGEGSGPTVIVVAGIHGNEPAGVHAARRLFAQLAGLPFRGELVVYAGNLGGLRKGLRYLSKDLNRVWTDQHLSALREGTARDAEDLEQLDLQAAIQEAQARARGPVVLIDLHSTSAAGIPFMLTGDTLPHRRFIRAFPIPVVLGLEEELDGVLSAHWARRGLITAAIEGGQHDDPATIGSLEAVLWVTLAQAGSVNQSLDSVSRATALLDLQRNGLPRIMEILSRRAIAPEDQFRMEPGFRNIDYARKGQLLARDRRGEIRAASDGLVIMPLYQGLGGDGYFWGRAVSSASLRASGMLRRSGAARLLGLLPGVARISAGKFSLARRQWLGLFRLLGYRRIRESGELLTVERNQS